jgi:hypothetical protein
VSAKSDRARRREHEKREAAQWAAWGWTAEPTWREMRGFMPGRRIPIIKNRDFFGAFDVHAVHPWARAYAGIQVTETPFVKERDGKADRNAEHGPPPWGFSPPTVSVEAYANEPHLGGSVVQVIVSYANPRAPDRRWWTVMGPVCPLPDPRQKTLDP